MKTHSVHQTKHQLRHNISRQVVFWNSWNWSGLLNDENKLTKRTKKTEKFEKYLMMYNIIIFKTIGFKLSALGNITHYRFMGNNTGNITGLWDRSEFYGYLEIKKGKKSNFTKKWSKKSFKAIREWSFSV